MYKLIGWLGLMSVLINATGVAWSATILEGVYHPKRLSDGTIDPKDFASLPENTWVRIAGSSYGALQNEVVGSFNEASGKAYGWNQLNVGVAGNIPNAVNGWTGGLWDEKRQRIVLMNPGGHTNGIVNGAWAWDVLHGEWRIIRPPSDPAQPRWSDAYRKTHSTTNYPSDDLPDEIKAIGHPFTDILPDGTPTARHQYFGEFHDTTRDRYCSSRVSLWCLDLTTLEYDLNTYKADGVPFWPDVPQIVIYDEINDQIRGLLMWRDGEYYDWRTADPVTGATQKIGAMVSEVFGGRGGTLERIPGTSQVLALSGTERYDCERYSVYDLRTGEYEIRNQLVNGCLSYDWRNELPGIAYVPQWGKWLRRMTRLIDGERCGWYLFDHETGKQTKINFDPNPTCVPFIGRKLRYSQPLGALVVLAGSDLKHEAVWMMRVGESPPAAVAAPAAVRLDLQKQIDASESVVVQPGNYAGTVRLVAPRDVDFAGVVISGATGNGYVEAAGGPHKVRNLTVTQPARSAVWTMHTPRVTVEGLQASNQQFGVISSNDGGELTIHDSTIRDGKGGEYGRTHNVYAGEIDRLNVRRLQSLGHHNAGHLLKSRAAESLIDDSVLDGLESHHSRILDFPCGGKISISDSKMRQSPKSDNNDLIAIGVESCRRNVFKASILTLENTTWIATRPNARFLSAKHPVEIVCKGTNRFDGVASPCPGS
ncbi:MAG: hypothetical protein KDI82_08455 [Gammaproteobacteria bacterium]|nr:hypothetical protein [Gammaproteobacteria bacterium]